MTIKAKVTQGGGGYFRWHVRDAESHKTICSSTSRYGSADKAREELKALESAFTAPLRDRMSESLELLKEANEKVTRLTDSKKHAIALSRAADGAAKAWRFAFGVAALTAFYLALYLFWG